MDLSFVAVALGIGAVLFAVMVVRKLIWLAFVIGIVLLGVIISQDGGVEWLRGLVT